MRALTGRLRLLLLLASGCAPAEISDPAVPGSGGDDWEERAVALRQALVAPGRQAGAGAYVPGQLLVRFRDGTADSTALAAHARAGGTLLRKLASAGALHRVALKKGETVLDAVARYRAQPDVLYAEPNYLVRLTALPNDSRLTEQWAHLNLGQTLGLGDADINGAEGWTLPLGATSPVVGIVDSGADLDHPDLVGRLWTNAGEIPGNGLDDDANGYVDDIHGIDATSASPSAPPADAVGHGTHVAGIVAAQANNGLGVAGTSPTARLAICRFLRADGTGAISDALECLQYFRKLRTRAQNPVPLVATNNSWSGGDYSQALVDEIAAQRAADLLFVTAAGNDHTDNDALGVFPGALDLPNLITVAATDASDQLAWFSSYGRRTTHVAAPGASILSTFPDNGYQVLDGTSMAAPYVTGLIALLKAQDATRSWKQLRNLVIAGGQVKPELANLTLSGRRLRVAGSGGVGSMSCSGQTVKVRRSPSDDEIFVAVGEAVRLSMLNINCADPAGAVQVQVSSGVVIPLRDDGVVPDEAAGDGSYTGTWNPAAAGVFSLTFADGSAVRAVVGGRARTVVPAPAPVTGVVGRTLEIPIAFSAPSGSGPWRIEGQFDHEGLFSPDVNATVSVTSGRLSVLPFVPGTFQGLVRIVDADGSTSRFSQLTAEVRLTTPRVFTIASTQLVARTGQRTTIAVYMAPGANDAGPWTLEWDVGYVGGNFVADGRQTVTSLAQGIGLDYPFASEASVTIAARVSSARGLSPVATLTLRGGYRPADVRLEPVVVPSPSPAPNPAPSPTPAPNPAPTPAPTPSPGGSTDPVVGPGPLPSPWIGGGTIGDTQGGGSGGGGSSGPGGAAGFVDDLRGDSLLPAEAVTGGCGAAPGARSSLLPLAVALFLLMVRARYSGCTLRLSK